MNDYFTRSELSPIDRSAPRAIPAISAVQSVPAQNPASNQDLSSSGGKPRPAPVATLMPDEEIASAADYAKVHARIADILADIRSEARPQSVDSAEVEIQSMLPAPIILVPLPPASKEVMESTVLLAKRIAEQASYAQAAQAHLKRGTVDQILSTVA